MIHLTVLSSIIMVAILAHISFKIIRRETLDWSDLACIVLASVYIILGEIVKLSVLLQ